MPAGGGLNEAFTQGKWWKLLCLSLTVQPGAICLPSLRAGLEVPRDLLGTEAPESHSPMVRTPGHSLSGHLPTPEGEEQFSWLSRES